MNNQVLTSDGSGGIVAESNMTFDGTLLNITGRTDIYDTIGNIPSLNILSQHNYPQHYSLSIHNFGTPTGNTKLYGAEIIVSGASSSNTGIIIDAGGNDNGNNIGIDVSNNSTGSGSLQYGIKGSVLGSMTNGLGIKYGSNFEVQNQSQQNIGYFVTVSDATIRNVGYSANILGTTGNSVGIQVLNANADTNGGDSQIGGVFNVTGNGSFASTNKKGLDVFVNGDAQSNVGLNVGVNGLGQSNMGLDVNVNGSSQTNIGLRSSASGALQNYAIYTSGGRFSFYHDPTTELTSTSVEGYGDIVTFGSGTLTAGDLCFLDAGATWNQTDASGTPKSIGMLAIALGSSPGDGMLVRGYVRNSLWTTFAIGDILYVDTTLGYITNIAPSSTGNVVRIIGYCVDSTNGVIYFNPDNTWVEL